jgi:hypothetical protein
MIVDARLAGGHDGRAEVVLDVRYSNGAVRSVTMSQEAVERALDASGIERLDDVVGRSWTVLLPPARAGRDGGT